MPSTTDQRHSVHHPGATPDCARCQGLGVRINGTVGKAQLLRCACVGSCPLCEDSGWLAAGINVHPCTCRIQQERQVLYDQAGIPSRVAGEPMQRWNGRPALEQALAWLMGWRPEPGARGLLIYDPSGEDGERLLATLLLEMILGVGARVRCLDLQEAHQTWPACTSFRVLALLGLGDEPNQRCREDVESGLAELEDEGGTLLATTRYLPAWESEGTAVALAERIDLMAAVFVLESCEALRMS